MQMNAFLNEANINLSSKHRVGRHVVKSESLTNQWFYDELMCCVGANGASATRKSVIADP